MLLTNSVLKPISVSKLRNCVCNAVISSVGGIGLSFTLRRVVVEILFSFNATLSVGISASDGLNFGLSMNNDLGIQTPD